MTTGEKIKRIRRHRQMTQKELGEKIGLGAGGANRIAQYEMGYRIPKRELLIKMAYALKVSPLALREPDTGTIGGVMETFLWLDEDLPGAFRLEKVGTTRYEPESGQERTGSDGKNHLQGRAAATVLWSKNRAINECLSEWYEKQANYQEGKITYQEYFEWKIRWPEKSYVKNIAEQSIKSFYPTEESEKIFLQKNIIVCGKTAKQEK